LDKIGQTIDNTIKINIKEKYDALVSRVKKLISNEPFKTNLKLQNFELFGEGVEVQDEIVIKKLKNEWSAAIRIKKPLIMRHKY